MLLQNQRRYSFIRIPSSLSRSVKLSYKKCNQSHNEPVKTAKPLTSQSLQESSTKLASSTWEEENEYDNTMQSLSMQRVRNACSKWSVREKNKSLLPACAPMHRRPRFLQHYASVCVARDPVMLLSFYLQAAGRYDDLLDVSTLKMQSTRCNEDTSPILSYLFRTDIQEHRRDSRSVENNDDDNFFNSNINSNGNNTKSLEHMVRIVQQMAVCVGASISRNAWPPWVTHFFEVREPLLEKVVSEEFDEHSQLSCKETRLDLQLSKLYTSRYRVGDIQQIGKDHSFSQLIIEARYLLQSTTLELLENSRQQEMNNIEKSSSNITTHDLSMFDILRLFAALCAICIPPSRAEAVSLARNILAKRQDAIGMVGLALRTFCFASKSWHNEEGEQCNDNICSSHSVEEVWLQMWEEVTRDVQTDVGKLIVNGINHNSKEDYDNTESISISNHSLQTEMYRPFTKFVYKTIGLDAEMIKEEYVNWHIHCLLCAKTQTHTLKLNTKTENVLQGTHEEEWEEEQQYEQESQRMKMSSLTLLLTGKAELTSMHDSSNECVQMFDKLNVQSVLELFALTPLSWLHGNHHVYQVTGEAILKFLQREYKLLSEEHVKKVKETYYTTTTTTTAYRKRRYSVFTTHVQLFVRTVNYLLFKLATSVSLLAQHSVYHDITCLLQLFNVKTMMHALTSSNNNNKKKNSNNEAIHDEFRCNNLHEVVSALYNIVTFVNCTRDKNTSRTNTTKTHCYDNENSNAPTYYEWHTTERPTHECEIEQNYRNHCKILYNDNNTGSTFPLAVTSKANNTTINHTEIAGSKLLHFGTFKSNAELQGTAHTAVNNAYKYKFGDENENIMFTNKEYNTVCLEETKLEQEENEVITHTIRVLCNLLISTTVTSSKQPVHTTKNEMPTLFNKKWSNAASRLHHYEFILSELPHKIINHVLEELLTHNYTAEVVQLCSCIVAHDLIDLRYYSLPLLSKLCQSMEWWRKNKYMDSTYSTGVYDEECMIANDFVKDNINVNTVDTMSLEDMKCVYEKLQKLYKRRSEVFGETMTTYNNISVDKQNNIESNIIVDSVKSELYSHKYTNKSCTNSNDIKRNPFKAENAESEFAISVQVPTSLSPLTQWGLPSKHADMTLLQTEDAKHEIQEFDKSQSCLYARKVASLYQLQHKPQVVSLLHSLLTRVSPLLGGGFTIDRQPHYYNFGEWQVKGNVSTSSSAQER